VEYLVNETRKVNDAILKSGFLTERASVFLILVISKTISVVTFIDDLNTF
jgi:hypothetical protein